MDVTVIRQYVDSRLKVAETYMEHGLVVESRDVFQQISTNLSKIRKRIDGCPVEFIQWFESVQGDIQEKLLLLNQETTPALGPAGRRQEDERDGAGYNPQSEYLKGIGLKDLGFYDDAVECFRNALQKGHHPYECLHEFLDVCKQKENGLELAQEVKESLNAYVMSPKECGELWGKLGVLYERSGLKQEAAEFLAHARELLSELQKTGDAEPQDKDKKSEGIPFEGLPEENASAEGEIEVQFDVVNENEEDQKEEKAAPVEAPDDLKELRLETETAAGSPQDTADIEDTELRNELERVRADLARAKELVEEYQKRYTAIMSQTNILQKENRDLQKKLAALEKKGTKN